MRHLRLVTAADTTGGTTGRTTGRSAGDDGVTAATGTGAAAPGARPAVRIPEGDDLSLVYVPARLVLALAGRCSCALCCTAYAEHRPEPHDPRRRRSDSPGLRAI